MKTITTCSLYKPVFVLELTRLLFVITVVQFGTVFSCHVNLQYPVQTPLSKRLP